MREKAVGRTVSGEWRVLTAREQYEGVKKEENLIKKPLDPVDQAEDEQLELVEAL